MNNELYYVYILTNWNHEVMYVGKTNDLKRRIKEHGRKTGKGFTRKYKVNKLVYFELFVDNAQALKRETQLKNWRRVWKDDLVISVNPEWKNLENTL